MGSRLAWAPQKDERFLKEGKISFYYKGHCQGWGFHSAVDCFPQMHKAHEVLGLVPSTVTNKTKDVPKNCLVTQLTYNHWAWLRKEFRGNGWCTDIRKAGVKVAAGQGG